MPQKKTKPAKPKPAAKTPKTAKPKATPTKKAAKEPKKQKFFRTGEKNPQSGLYAHFCKAKGEKSTIPLSKSETFPPCRNCGSVKWVLVMAA
ncbi:MAG: YjzC family protein [Candidatus Bathyarchaeota archaeon]|nr:YjzC family protein [Candidatus Bathyarchaeota archaeon]